MFLLLYGKKGPLPLRREREVINRNSDSTRSVRNNRGGVFKVQEDRQFSPLSSCVDETEAFLPLV